MLPKVWSLGLCTVTVAKATSSQIPDPLPPSLDPWYRAPAGWESTEPGAVLRFRAAPGNLTSAVLHNASATYNILYRTTDSHHQPSWAVTTLFIPNVESISPSGSRALLSYQFAYDSANVDSSPSYGLYYQLAQPDPTLGVPSDTSLIDLLLGNGWYVNAPDFEGPLAAFGAQIQAGHATLDAQRAVLSLPQNSSPIKADGITLALWGYSGGSIATAAATELQVQYAPELSIAGAAIGGAVANFSADIDYINGSAISGDVVSLILGLMAEYPAVSAYVRSRLVPATANVFLGTYNMTLSKTTAYFSFKDIFKYFLGGRDDLYNSSVMQQVYAAETVLGTYGVPKTPLYVYKAIGDEYCPVKETDALVNKYCAFNVNVTYRRNTIGGHVAEIINGQPGALQWLRGIFNESFVPLTACSIQNVTVNVTDYAG